MKTKSSDIQSSRPYKQHSLLISIILTAFTCISLYKFTTPSMWHDEMMVAVSTWLDLIGVIKKYYYTDFHPPYYSLIIKLLSYTSREDYILKILSPIATILSIYIGYKESSQFGDKFRISLAIIMATNFWVILLSRQLRPYALTLLFSTYCFYSVIKISTERKQSILLYSASIFSLGLLHYGNMLIIGPQVIFLAWHIFKNKPQHSQLLLIGIFLSTCLSLLLIVPFYLRNASAWMDEIPFISRILKLFNNFFSLITGAEISTRTSTQATSLDLIIPISIFLIISKFILTGFYTLIKTNRKIAVFSALWIMPLALHITIPAKQYGEFQAWHLTPLLPALFFICAIGASEARKTTIIAFAIISAFNIFTNKVTLYSEAGAKGIYKTVAKIICETNNNTLNIISSTLTHTFTSWYVESECKTNRLSNISFGPETSTINFRYFSGAGALAGMIDQDDEKVVTTYFSNIKPKTLLIPTQGALDGNKTFKLSLYESYIDREPFPTHELRDSEVTLISKSPFDILRNFNSLSDVSMKPRINAYSGGTSDFYLFSSKHNSPGIATFKVRNMETDHIKIECEYLLKANGSISITVSSESDEVVFSDIIHHKSATLQKYSRTAQSPRDRTMLITLSLHTDPDNHIAVRSNAELGITSFSVSPH